jgi:hypothetical protein
MDSCREPLGTGALMLVLDASIRPKFQEPNFNDKFQVPKDESWRLVLES